MSGQRILIVEDDGIIAYHIETSLKRLGYCISGMVSNGEDAVLEVQNNPPHLVLMDISLVGKLDGVEAANLIRKKKDIPIVFLTANADPGTLQRAKVTDPFGFILKPFEDRYLQITIEMSLNKHALERRIRESEQRFRTLIENQSEGVAIVDPLEEFVFANPAANQIFGVLPDSLVGHTLRDFTTADQFSKIQHETLKRFEGKRSVYEIEICRQDGQSRDIQITATPWLDQDGNLVGTFGILVDITERKRIEAAEREQRNLAEALRDTAAVLTSSLDINEVFDRILLNVGLVVPHHAANIMLVEQDNGRVVRWHGYSQKLTEEEILNVSLKIKETDNLNSMMITKKPIVISNTFQSDKWIRMPINRWTRSYLGAPIVIQGEVAGFLNLDHAVAGFYTPEHAERLKAFADQAAIAIQNANLFADVQNRSNLLTLLNEITQTAIRIADLDTLLKLVAQSLLKWFKADEVYAILENENQTSVFYSTTTESSNTEFTEDDLINATKGLTSEILSKHQTIAMERIHDSLSFVHSAMDIIPACSILGLPLISDDQELGVILIGYRAPRKFTGNEIDRAEQSARQIALGISKVKLDVQVKHLAVTDDLTGLYNRRGLSEQAVIVFNQARRYHRSLTAIWIDLDRFKGVNDRYDDHAIGDQTLKKVARILKLCLRDVDIIGRYGGDEFVIVLPETDLEEAARVAERLRQTISNTPIHTDKGEFNLTASLGVAGLSPEHDELAVLLNHADQAMYAAKDSGRNRVVVHDQ